MGGFVPKVYQDAMQVFLDKIPPRDFQTEIIPIIERELCNKVGAKSYHEVFEYIDPVPLGCASIGQVHRAVLINKNKNINGGKNFRVVIKVLLCPVCMYVCVCVCFYKYECFN
jgi:predicted unusual protein kinase regulating ubiquinone biosynthesis (AarF/ABC1/UbiB family)